ncbi:MAG: CoA-binding protein [Balneola sp.]|jgi:predicted CoA-binding protein|nr:CoA-binding protein [Balneola sp.]MBE79370.1 CoA-binding protein [Balneola sp.]|tara:strand:- start:2174 stop:2602 length:429 start_codon:yes stop_codon:yes gene_type:complete
MIETISNINEALSEAKVIAMIGCSPDMYRTSNYAAKFLQEKGYRVIPVNPKAEEIFGEKCYNSINDIPEDVQIDMVNVFRNSEYAADAVQEVADWKEKTSQNPIVWTQLDVSSPEAEQIAEENQLPYVRNKCIMVEWDRYFK